MAKNRFICKLLALSLAMLTASSSAFALSTEKIWEEVTVENYNAINGINSTFQGLTFGDYINLERIRESCGFRNFVSTNCINNREQMDSALFVSLLGCIYRFDIVGSSRRRLESLKESLFKHMISLRTPEEVRNDKFIASKFDDCFKSPIKDLLKHFRPQSPSHSKMHRKARYETSEELYITP